MAREARAVLTRALIKGWTWRDILFFRRKKRKVMFAKAARELARARPAWRKGCIRMSPAPRFTTAPKAAPFTGVRASCMA